MGMNIVTYNIEHSEKGKKYEIDDYIQGLVFVAVDLGSSLVQTCIKYTSSQQEIQQKV